MFQRQLVFADMSGYEVYSFSCVCSTRDKQHFRSISIQIDAKGAVPNVERLGGGLFHFLAELKVSRFPEADIANTRFAILVI
jgi:hypothetical protein